MEHEITDQEYEALRRDSIHLTVLDNMFIRLEYSESVKDGQEIVNQIRNQMKIVGPSVKMKVLSKAERLQKLIIFGPKEDVLNEIITALKEDLNPAQQTQVLSAPQVIFLLGVWGHRKNEVWDIIMTLDPLQQKAVLAAKGAKQGLITKEQPDRFCVLKEKLAQNDNAQGGKAGLAGNLQPG